MEVNEQNQAALASYLTQTLQPNTRVEAERSLRSVEDKAQFPILLLTLIGNRSADMPTRQAGSVFFKNFVRRRWPQVEGEADQLHPEDRQTIRSSIVDMMVTLEPILQTQIGETLSLIAQADFPSKWPDLITVLVSKFSPTDYNVNIGILQTAHYIFSQWEGKFETDELYSEINLVLAQFCKPYLQLLLRTDELIQAGPGDLPTIKLLMHAMELLALIFQDLSSKDLPPFMEDNMSQFMQIWHKYFTYSNPLLEADADEDQPGPMELVRTAICGIVELYTIKYGEDFPMVTQFIESIWKLLSDTGKDARFDGLVGKSMAFLTVVIRLRRHQELFQDQGVKRQLLEKIVLPNLEIRPSDEESFEDEPLLYVRRDVEGVDGDSRRKGAADLVRGLLEVFPTEITEIASTFVTHCLTLYEASPGENWRQKDTALALLTAVSSTSISGVSHGVSSTSKLFDIGSVYDQYIQNDLRAPGESIPYLLQVDAIRYLLAYRRQLTRDRLLAALPSLLARLTSANIAVHTYAAFGLERLLAEPAFRPTEAELQPMAEALISHPLRLLLPEGPTGPAPQPQKLAENEFPMRMIFRAVQVLRAPGAGPYVESIILPYFVQIIFIMAQNPSNPKFTHYTFEALCTIITTICQEKPEVVETFEKSLEPVYKVILEQGIPELTPYILQVMALTINVHSRLPGKPLPGMYQAVFPALLQPVAWESHANIPALTMIIRAYLRVDHVSIVSNNQFEPILGIFQKLIASRMNDHHGFELLETLAGFVPWEVMSKYWKAIFTLLLKRLQGSKTDKFTRSFLYFAYFTALLRDRPGYGPDFCLALLEEIQPGLAVQVFQSIMLPDLEKVLEETSVRVCVAGLMTMLCTNPRFVSSPFVETWPRAFEIGQAMANKPWANKGEKSKEADAVYLVDLEEAGYQASFSRLSIMGSDKVKPPVDTSDLPRLVGTLVRAFDAAHPGKIAQLLAGNPSSLQWAQECGAKA